MDVNAMWKWVIGVVMAAASAIGVITWWNTEPQELSENPLIEEKSPESKMGVEGQFGTNPPSYDPEKRKYNYEK